MLNSLYLFKINWQQEDIVTVLDYLKYELLKWQVAMQLLIFIGCLRSELIGL